MAGIVAIPGTPRDCGNTAKTACARLASVSAAIGSAPIEAVDAEVAAFTLAETITEAFPSAIAVRVDQDLVSIPDIAERTGRSRESVRLLVEGKRGPGGFPPPIGTVGDGIRVWPWATVTEWFARSLGEDLGERGIPPEVAAVVDACLATRRRRPDSPRPSGVDQDTPARCHGTADG